MTTPTDVKYVVIDPDVLGGRPSISGHRIGVIHVATWTQQGVSPAEIATLYGLTLAYATSARARANCSATTLVCGQSIWCEAT
jgi:uncharacterized protein (DUF433 family)